MLSLLVYDRVKLNDSANKMYKQSSSVTILFNFALSLLRIFALNDWNCCSSNGTKVTIRKLPANIKCNANAAVNDKVFVENLWNVVSFHSFVTSAGRGGDWSTSWPSRFTAWQTLLVLTE